jgi:MinD superfamily P-loop ATPase
MTTYTFKKGDKVYTSTEKRYNHGCTNWAEFECLGDNRFLCTDCNSCHSCWQVGHDDNYEYYRIGEIYTLEELNDIEEEL